STLCGRSVARCGHAGAGERIPSPRNRTADNVAGMASGTGGLTAASLRRGTAWSDWRRPRPEPGIQRSDVVTMVAVLGGMVLLIVLVNSMGLLAFGTAPSIAEQLAWGTALCLPLVARRRFRSEERRVGKEGRCRWTLDRQKQ